MSQPSQTRIRRKNRFPRRFWTAQELDTVRTRYPAERTDKIAKAIGRSVLAVYQAADKLGLKKGPEFFASPESGILRKGETRPNSIPHQFKKGQVPFNKGLRRPGWSVGRMRETQFRKGERSGIAAQNWRPIGTILPDTEGYLRIKVREAIYGKEPTGFGNVKVWPLLQRHVWEQAHGPVPPSHVVCFRDGDRNNCDLGNLECISRADLARRNVMWARYPRELAEAIQANGALKRKMRRLSDGKK